VWIFLFIDSCPTLVNSPDTQEEMDGSGITGETTRKSLQIATWDL